MNKRKNTINIKLGCQRQRLITASPLPVSARLANGYKFQITLKGAKL